MFVHNERDSFYMYCCCFSFIHSFIGHTVPFLSIIIAIELYVCVCIYATFVSLFLFCTQFPLFSFCTVFVLLRLLSIDYAQLPDVACTLNVLALIFYRCSKEFFSLANSNELNVNISNAMHFICHNTHFIAFTFASCPCHNIKLLPVVVAFSLSVVTVRRTILIINRLS